MKTFLMVLIVSMMSEARPVIGVGENDYVKDIDFINQTIANENAKVVSESLSADGPTPKVEVIIDSSGSMGQILAKNKSKMYFLKEFMKPFFRARWKEKNNIGMRVYGGHAKDKCEDSRLAVPFSDRNLTQMEKKLESLGAVGMTPLHKSLKLAFDDVKDYKGPKRVVIVTDGNDTCGGDPCETVEELKKHNLDLKFFVIALGFKGDSESLKKIKCIGDTQVADSDESFQDAVSQVGSKISNRDNLRVISPNPSAPVYLFQILPDGKKNLERVFYANSTQTVPPGKYEAIVGLEPLYKFSEFEIPANKKVTLTVAGDGTVKVNFFNSLMNAEILDKNSKVIKRFKSDIPVEIPTGKWRVRIFKDPFYEQIFPEFFVYPKGKHDFDVAGAGVARVDREGLQGLYVYDQEGKELGQGLTSSIIVIKSGVYSFHVDEKCTFLKVQIFEKKEITVLPCQP